MMTEILATNKFTPVLHIFDARPSANARANQVKVRDGRGGELSHSYFQLLGVMLRIDDVVYLLLLYCVSPSYRVLEQNGWQTIQIVN